MFDETELAGQLNPDLFLIKPFLLKPTDATRQVLLVALGHLCVVMVEHIAAEPNTRPRGTDIVVGIQFEVVVTSQVHDYQVSRNPEKCLVLVHDEEVVHKSEVMPEAFTGKPLEAFCQEYTTLGQ